MSQLENLEWEQVEVDGERVVYEARQLFVLVELTSEIESYSDEVYVTVEVFVDSNFVGRRDTYEKFEDEDELFEWATDAANELLEENGY